MAQVDPQKSTSHGTPVTLLDAFECSLKSPVPGSIPRSLEIILHD